MRVTPHATRCDHWFRPSSPHPPTGCACFIDATMTHQRVQTLVAMGWSLRDQGAQLGMRTPYSFAVVLKRQRVTRHTALRVAQMFDRLWNVPGPSPRSVTSAIKKGWPVADPEVVARLVAGQDCPRNELERDIAIRILARKNADHTANSIALHLHTRFQTVRRVLNEAA